MAGTHRVGASDVGGDGNSSETQVSLFLNPYEAGDVLVCPELGGLNG